MRAMMTRIAVAATLLSVVHVSTAEAQRRPAAAMATRAGAAQGGEAGGSSNFTLFAGVATGEGGYDIGPAVQGSFKLANAKWPVAIRIDPYLARHSGSFSYSGNGTDISLTMIGAAGNVEYAFKNSESNVEPYVLGGLGLYYGKSSVSNNTIGFEASGSDTNLGFGFGGGIRFAKRWSAEGQYKSINGFDTIPLLLGYHF
ncbi:MAG: hypothetical protein MNPFHGCM_00018 [Gemmatimonadaceae bacterium]|nr:hypothetical protein [Gemmatimonadaceae bacterium]